MDAARQLLTSRPEQAQSHPLPQCSTTNGGHANLAQPQGPPNAPATGALLPVSPPPSISTDPQIHRPPAHALLPYMLPSSCCLPPTHNWPGLCPLDGTEPLRRHRAPLPAGPPLCSTRPHPALSPAPHTGETPEQDFTCHVRPQAGLAPPRPGPPPQVRRPCTLARTVTVLESLQLGASPRTCVAASSTPQEVVQPRPGQPYSFDLGAGHHCIRGTTSLSRNPLFLSLTPPRECPQDTPPADNGRIPKRPAGG